MYQEVTIVGHVGRDPEMRYTADGVGVCSFSVAVNMGYGDREKTVWFRVSAWRQLAETCSQYVHKGMLVLVSGSVEARAYTANDGTARASLDLNAQRVKFLSRRDDSGGSYESRDDYAAEDVDDIPF
jgi:single-strand DNA-binding protein